VDNELQVHHGRRLGRQRPSNKVSLRLGNYLTGTVPAHPAAADHFANVSDWGMYANDQFGDCGPTSVANSRKLITKYLAVQEASPSQDDVFDLYRRSGNPKFNPDLAEGDPNQDDNGVDMQTMLSAAVKGGIGGVKPLGFAKVDTSNLDEMRAAIAIFGFLLLGVDLQTAQQTQTDAHLWDYKSSGEWGGHAILAGRYVTASGKDRLAVVTWAEVVDTTDAFLAHQCDEAWVVIWPEHLSSSTFLAGVDLTTFAADYKAITGRDFPATVPPTPAPTPPPAPTPTPTPTPEPPPFLSWSTISRWWTIFSRWLRGMISRSKAG
jgi:hypothetical protein